MSAWARLSRIGRTIRTWVRAAAPVVQHPSFYPTMLTLILLLGGILRFTGLNWDEGHGIHPDERFLRMVVNDIKWPQSIGEYFNGDVSKLNPRNVGHGFWVYGDLPIILVNRVGALLHRGGYDGVEIVGRAMSGLVDLLGVLLLYVLGKKLFSKPVGLLAAALMAFSVLDIQLSHFFAVDTFGAFFAVVAMLCAVRVAERGSWWDYVALGVAVAAAVASKVSLGIFVVIAALAWLIWTLRETKAEVVEEPEPAALVEAPPPSAEAVSSEAATLVEAPLPPVDADAVSSEPAVVEAPAPVPPAVKPRRRMTWEGAILRGVVCALMFVIAFRVFQPSAFKGPGFLNFSLSEKFLANMKEAGASQTGEADPPWGFQWASRTPYLFPLYNIVLYGLGVPLALAAFGGWVLAAWELVRKKQWVKALPWAWVTILFAYQGLQFVKSMRYFIPIYPFLALLAGYGIVRLVQWARTRSHRATVAAAVVGALVVLATAFYAFAFMRIYVRDHPRIAASYWIYENLPAAATLHYHTPEGDAQTQLNIPHNQQFAPGAPAVQSQFRLPSDGELLSVTFNRLRDAGAEAKPTTIRVSIKRPGNEKDVLTSAAITGEFEAGTDGKGLSYTLDLTGVTLAQGVEYVLAVSVEAGDALIAQSSTIVEETYDDPKVPFSFVGRDPFRIYNIPELRAYDEDNPEKLKHFQDMLGQADYLAFTSQRGYASIPRLAARFPMATKFYELLFAGKLGFQLVAQFTDYPGIGGITFNDDNSEEAFTVYDHAKVLIFQKTEQISADRLAELISPPDWTTIPHYTAKQASSWKDVSLMLTPQEVKQQTEGGTWSQIFDRNGWVNQVPVLIWLLFAELLGLVAMPFCFLAFRKLADRGYAFAKPIGVLLLAFLLWIVVSLKLATFSRTTIGAMLLLMILAAAAIAWWQRERLVPFVRAHWRRLLIMDGIFLGFFLVFLLIRFGNPDLWHPAMGGEKPMDFAYLNAVIKSSTFPPYDPWFSGGYLNYYYFGQVMMATLIKFLGIVPAVAYNLTLPLLAGMVALAAFGVVVNLLPRKWSDGARWPAKVWLFGVGGSLAVAVLGNLGEIQLILQGLTQLGGPAFDSKIPGFAGLVTAIKGLGKVLGGAKLPFRPEWWYWNASRIIPETINEFPFFSFVYADLHAHLLAMPLTVTVIGLAVNLVRGAGDVVSTVPAWLGRLPAKVADAASRLWRVIGGWDLACLAALALAVGALRITNTWDLPTALLLAGGAFAIRTVVTRKRVDWKGVVEVLVVLALVYLFSGWFYGPFHAKYGAFYTGIEQWKGLRTHLLDFGIVAGVTLFAMVTYLLTMALGRGWRQGPLGWLGLAGAYRWETPRLWKHTRALSGRFSSWWPGLTAAIGVVLLAMIVLFVVKLPLVGALLPFVVLSGALIVRRRVTPESRFLLFLVFLGLCISAGTEVIVIKGDIGRMNTVFKFYLQVWLMWGVAAVAALAALSEQLPRWRAPWRQLWMGLLALLVFCSALYPVFAAKAKINDRYDVTRGPSLDGMAYMENATWSENNKTLELKWDRDAINWILDNVQGSPVIAEGNQSGVQYHWYSRISIYTGLPTIVGWQWHQMQQRAVMGQAVLDKRQADLKTLYETRDEAEFWNQINKYSVRYVYVGELERSIYSAEGLAKIDKMVDSGTLSIAYSNERVKLYEVAPQ